MRGKNRWMYFLFSVFVCLMVWMLSFEVTAWAAETEEETTTQEEITGDDLEEETTTEEEPTEDSTEESTEPPTEEEEETAAYEQKISTKKSVTITDWNEHCFSFTVPLTGEYTLSVNSNQTLDVTLKDADGNWLKSQYSSEVTITRDFEKGKTYYVYVWAGFHLDYETISYTVSLQSNIQPYLVQEGQEVVVAKGTRKTLRIKYSGLIKSVAWESTRTNIVKVSKNGTLIPVKKGRATVKISGVDKDGKKFSSKVIVCVTNPKLNKTTVTMNLYTGYKNGGYYVCGNNSVKLTGYSTGAKVKINRSSTRVKVEKSYLNNGTEYFVYPKKTGTYTIKFTVDGKVLKCKVKVQKIYFKRNKYTMADGNSSKWIEGYSMVGMYPGMSTTLKLKGIPRSSAVKWTSSNRSVATVNKKGKITAKRSGYTTITAKVNGMKLTYEVGVASKTAIMAVRHCQEKYGSIYSQEKRMQEGYYDCSSFVWRAYNAVGYNVGGATGWAPTAAAMAQWCSENGYMLYTDVAQVGKLLPGDLIFEKAWYDNGRYNNIYHVDMFQGNYSSVTVDRMKYYGSTLYDVMVARPCP